MDERVGAAARLPGGERRKLAIQALAGSEAVTDLAASHGVGRKFVYQQTHKARAALDAAFSPAVPDSAVLFELAMTKADTPRGSSLVENLKSRPHTYFALRRHLGSAYLDLLRFFLNHRRFLRTRHAERCGKSPRGLLTGQAHPHWLTLLGLGELQPRRA